MSRVVASPHPYPLPYHVKFRTSKPCIPQQTNNFPDRLSAGARSNNIIHHRICVPLATAKDRSHQNSQTVLDQQYFSHPINPHSSYLEPSPLKIRDGSNEPTSPATIRPDCCSYPPTLPALPELNPRQKPTQLYPARHEPTMNAAERFLENFLRNTSDEQTPNSNENEKKAMLRSPPRVPRQRFKSSPLQSIPRYRDQRTECSPRPDIDSHHSSEIGAHFDGSRDCSHEIALLPLVTDRYGHSQSRPSEIAPSDGSVSRCSTRLQKNDNRVRSPNQSIHDNRYHRQPSINLVGKYNNHSYARKDNTCSGKQYPPPLSNDYYQMKDTHWSPNPPVAYPVPPLPPMLPAPGYYDTQYGIDYRERTRSRDPLPHSPAQYSRYLPPRPPASEGTYIRRSRSPPVITRSSQHVAVSYTSVSAPLPRGYGTAEDYRRANGRNSDIHHQPQRGRREPGNVVWQGQGRGRVGGRGRGGARGKTNSGR